MRFAFALSMIAFTTKAGVVRGVVSEHISGLPLARTHVRLQPVPRPGVETRPLTMRAESSGSFVFQNVPDGLYLLIATRDPYFPAAFGQRRPEGHGTPIEVTKDSDLFAELRMYRKGAVTGRVLDENGIGMEQVPVIAYRARLPLRAAGRAVSDGRGVYRVYGLDPGKYWVRTVAHTLDDGEGRLPTFGREGREISESHVHPVRLDEDTPDADVRPFPGRLFRLRGRVLCDPGPVPVLITITLSSETGRKTAQGGCMQSYTFEGLSPAVYEVFATKQGDGADAGFIEVQLDHNTDNGDVQVSPVQRADFIVRRAGASGVANIPVTIYGHRQDLSESDDDKEIPLHAMLAPGQWEFTVHTGPGVFVQSMTNAASLRRAQLPTIHPPDWFDLFLDGRGFSQVTVVLSDQAATMQGSVTQDTRGVPGAPVFLWPMAESARRSLHGWRETITDIDGHFKFDSLPPGDYRMLATFDVTEIDEEKLDEAHAIIVHVDAASSANADLQVWIAP
jgi:hypothetical protein